MTRHRWSAPSRPSRFKTERECLRCGLIKVTRHEGVGSGAERHWTEWWRPGPRDPDGAPGLPVTIDSDHTPACEPARAEEDA